MYVYILITHENSDRPQIKRINDLFLLHCKPKMEKITILVSHW